MSWVEHATRHAQSAAPWVSSAPWAGVLDSLGGALDVLGGVLDVLGGVLDVLDVRLLRILDVLGPL